MSTSFDASPYSHTRAGAAQFILFPMLVVAHQIINQSRCVKYEHVCVYTTSLFLFRLRPLSDPKWKWIAGQEVFRFSPN
jgi:hypothetical protein